MVSMQDTATDQTPALVLQPGEVVDIHITGARVSYMNGAEGTQYFEVEAGEDERRLLVSLKPRPGVVDITRRTPADGEPQPGELWRDAAGRIYFAGESNGAVVLYPPIDPDGYSAAPWELVHGGTSGPIDRPDVWEAIELLRAFGDRSHRERLFNGGEAISPLSDHSAAQDVAQPADAAIETSDDASSQRCDRCHRKTWDVAAFGGECRMPQPDGFACGGSFGAVS